MHLFPLLMKEFRGTLTYLLVRGFHGGVLNYWIVLGVQWGISLLSQVPGRLTGSTEVRTPGIRVTVAADECSIKCAEDAAPTTFPV